MKKIVILLSVVTILAIGTVAFAHNPGGYGGDGHMMGPGYGNHMMGPGYGNYMMRPGYGNHMMGPGYGNHMMGPGYGNNMMDRGYGNHMKGWGGQTEEGQKFLSETRDLRKELHDKRFEYFEASRDPNITQGTLNKLEKEIYDLREKIHGKAPASVREGAGDPGHCL
jgi:hypothetical protein